MDKPMFQLSGFARKTRPILASAALFLLAFVLISSQYTIFADAVYTGTFSNGAQELQSIAYDTNNKNQRIYPVTSTANDSLPSITDGTFINDTVDRFSGDQQGPGNPPTDNDSADFNFAAAGDWGCNPDSSETVSGIVGRAPELVLGLGDYSYRSTADCWLDLIDPIDSLTKIAFGNHDVGSSRLTNQYLDHFGLENQFYSFDYQNVHFLVVSSEIPYAVGSEQYNFIENDLESAASDPSIDWIVAYHHKLQYTSRAGHSSEAGLRQALHPLFDKYGVDLVLQGHNHSYERTYPLQYDSASPSGPIISDTSTRTYGDPRGVIYVTVGTGGAPNHEYSEEKPYSIIQWIGHGFLNIDIANNGLTMEGKLYSNDDGTVEDSFTINKSGSGINRTDEDSSTA